MAREHPQRKSVSLTDLRTSEAPQISSTMTTKADDECLLYCAGHSSEPHSTAVINVIGCPTITTTIAPWISNAQTHTVSITSNYRVPDGTQRPLCRLKVGRVGKRPRGTHAAGRGNVVQEFRVTPYPRGLMVRPRRSGRFPQSVRDVSYIYVNGHMEVMMNQSASGPTTFVLTSPPRTSVSVRPYKKRVTEGVISQFETVFEENNEDHSPSTSSSLSVSQASGIDALSAAFSQSFETFSQSCERTLNNLEGLCVSFDGFNSGNLTSGPSVAVTSAQEELCDKLATLPLSDPPAVDYSVPSSELACLKI